MASKLAGMRATTRMPPSSEIPLTLLAVGWFLSCTFITCLTNAYLDRANPFVALPFDERRRLPDPLVGILHHVYRSLLLPRELPDTLVHIAPMLMLLRVLLAGENAYLILRRLAYLVGVGYLVRAPFVVMTLLPNPLLDCRINPNPSLFLYALEMMAQWKTSCGDVVFSGHTIMFMSASLVWIENPVNWFSEQTKRLVEYSMIIFSALSILSLLGATYHYTLDCTLSILTMLFVWKFYHFVIRTHYFDDTYVGRLILWADGPGLRQGLMTPLPLLGRPSPML
ncbi:hypothetical protein DSO57_1038874 [Entomophthora muscae]|uniref:Uncharacterized protein n=1 Tax=Entomophthora muscae TaxID=34485 RepID=A0ACC2S0X6_9FUNG|nr:hypothetical protein DSO57_1038874 [Entomophthora muscae]